MAFATGTATSHTDLFDKLVTFLTTNPALVAADQAWSKAWQHTGGDQKGVVLAGPGLAGLDRVLVGLDLTSEPASGSYWITTRGMTGVIGSAENVAGHVNVSPRRVRTYLDTGAMTYWFIANGRRFVVIVKISTVFQSLYAGLFLPYATPLQYPYPMFVGGTAGDETLSPDSWRNLSAYHAAFPFARWDRDPSSTAGAFQGQAWVLSPSAEWFPVGGHIGSIGWPPVFFYPSTRPQAYFAYATQGNSIGSNGQQVPVPENVHSRTGLTRGDGLPVLLPLQLVREAPAEALYGLLDGCLYLGGDTNAAENIITVSGVDHLVVQDTFRAGMGSYFVAALE